MPWHNYSFTFTADAEYSTSPSEKHPKAKHPESPYTEEENELRGDMQAGLKEITFPRRKGGQWRLSAMDGHLIKHRG